MTRVVQRVFALMEAFDGQRSSLPLHELATRADLPKPTAFRLLASLVEAGYVYQLDNQEYSLSHKLMRLAAAAQRNFSIRDVARPIMQELVEETGETVDLSILSGAQRVCIEVLESPHPLKSIIQPGQTLSLDAGASGKLLLAYNEAELFDEVMRKSTRKPNRAALKRELSDVRDRGYAHSRGERVEGVEAISVPLRDHTGATRYSLTLTGPEFRFQGKQDRFIALLRNAGEQISYSLGAPDPATA